MRLQNKTKIKNGKATIAASKTVEERWCYLMLALPILGFVVFHVYPIIWTFGLSFFNYNQIPSNTRFVGFENFKTAFRDATYWKTWITTFQFTVLKTPIELSLAMFIALVLMNMKKAAGFFRSMYYLPSVISVVILGLAFSNLFSYFGFMNAMLKKLGLISKEIEWLTSTKWRAMFVLVFASIWHNFGINVLYFVAALTNVPKELYECAELDGANKWQQFKSITLPCIKSVGQIILLMSIVGTLGVNELIIVLTNGGPAGQTKTVMSYLYTKFVPGFTSDTTVAIGYGCALSFISTIIFVAVAIGYNRLSKKLTE